MAELPDSESLKFVEANPEAPENEPDQKDQYSFRNQQAADNALDQEISKVPYVEGEAPSQKIIQGDPLPSTPLTPGVYSSSATRPGEDEEVDSTRAPSINDAWSAPSKPMPLPDFLKQEATEEEGTGSHPHVQGKAKEPVDQMNPNAPLDVYKTPSVVDMPVSQKVIQEESDTRPMPRARPRLSADLLHGPLMSSASSAGRRGQLAIDATFSQFGEYQQQFYAAVQVGWYQEIDFFQPIDTSARVVVRFTMQANGSIQEVEAMETTASEIATLICENAIIKRSPFRPWTKEMIEVFGKERTLHVVFYYR